MMFSEYAAVRRRRENIMSETLQKFMDYQKKLAKYRTVTSLLYWEIATEAPRKGIPALIDTLSFFSTKRFELETAKEYGELIAELAKPEEYEQLDEAMKLTVRRYSREFEKNSRIPQAFYTEFVEASSHSERAWREAKEKQDYSIFCPHLQKMIDMKRQMTMYTDPDKEVYDAMIDQYEEGMDCATINRLFSELKAELVPFVQKLAAQPQPDRSIFEGHYDIDAQRHLQDFLLDYIGFSHEAGTTGETEHPFTDSISKYDVRVTNHYREDEAIDAMFTAIHEGGHAIFDQNIAPEYEYTAVNQVNMMGLHESQSRFFENILGRNINFWKPIYGKLGEFLLKFREITLEQFEREINRVQCSMIRTGADEVTYAFHIILRYELEQAIFRDGVTAKELPALWNQKMQELLGICPANDAEGILQDVHWSDGSFGYFPSYLLGSIYDGMYLEQIEQELGDLDTILAEGRVKEITHWLNEKIHRHGSMYTSSEVIRRLCGKEISAQPLIRYFKEKYTRIYGLGEKE